VILGAWRRATLLVSCVAALAACGTGQLAGTAPLRAAPARRPPLQPPPFRPPAARPRLPFQPTPPPTAPPRTAPRRPALSRPQPGHDTTAPDTQPGYETTPRGAQPGHDTAPRNGQSDRDTATPDTPAHNATSRDGQSSHDTAPRNAPPTDLPPPLSPPVAPLPLTAPGSGPGALTAAAARGLLGATPAPDPRRAAAFRRWGIPRPTPPPPPPPAVKPVLTAGVGTPPVIGRVPTTDRVVFLTVDDGSEKDPAFVRMVHDLGTPVTAFLADDTAGDDYRYFRPLRDLGGAIGNHTLHHPDLPTLPYRRQRAEICGQRDTLRRAFGAAPRLFRPPYGAYDHTTLRAAGACGVRVVVLWGLEATPGRIAWLAPDRRLRPGDIILSHFRGPAEWDGTMTAMLRRVLRTAAAQGFAVARLEDYL
jgi:peptidoglycan/xylan/chitin deacetylase (PgdA/CDA1 family)